MALAPLVAALTHSPPVFHAPRPDEPSKMLALAKAFFGYFGAHQETGGKITFRLYAPNARKVMVLKQERGNSVAEEMQPVVPRENGVWEVSTDQFKILDNYLFKIELHTGKILVKLDPFSFTNNNRYLTSAEGYRITNQVVGSEPYPWTDIQWMNETRGKRAKEHINIYEVYPNCWKKGEDDQVLSYRELAPLLIKHCQDMGYTHIQLMATLDYFQDKGTRSFQVTSYFSPNSRLGTKRDFQDFVNQLHAKDIGVILVWIPNHCSGAAMGLTQFDGTPVFEVVGGVPSQFGPLFDFSKPATQNFLLSSAVYWADEMHVDGFYVDCMGIILSRNGKENKECRFLEDFNSLLHDKFSGILTFSEDSDCIPKWTSFNSGSPHHFDYMWHYHFVSSTLDLLKKAPSQLEKYHYYNYFTRLAQDPSQIKDNDYAIYLAHIKKAENEFPENSAYKKIPPPLTQTENCLLAWSSALPDVKNPVVQGQSLLKEMPGTDEEKYSRLALLYALTLAVPGKKLIFMGHEFGQIDPWNLRLESSFENQNGEIKRSAPAAVDWEELREGSFQKKLNNLHQELNRVYQSEKAFWEREHLPGKGFRNLNFDFPARILTFERFGTSNEGSILCVFNFSEKEIEDYRLKTQEPHQSAKILSRTAATNTLTSGSASTIKMAPFSALYIKRD